MNSQLSLAHPASNGTNQQMPQTLSSHTSILAATSLHSAPPIRKLEIIFTDLQKSDTICTPGLTLYLQKLANTYTIIQNDFLEDILRLYGGHLLQYYHQLYSTGVMTTLSKQRDQLLLNAQYDTNQIQSQYGGSKSHSSPSHPALHTGALNQSNYTNKVGLSDEVSSNENSIQQELNITTVPIPTLPNLNTLQHFLTNNFTPSLVRLEFFCKTMCEEFLILQRQKEAHMAFSTYIISHFSKIQAQKELLMWDELIFELDVLPDDETFFDLPL
jgi:hypothetical protein